MAALTPISRKPLGFVLPIIAAAGALVGLFFGTANGSGFIGMVVGAALMASLAYLYVAVLQNERNALFISMAICLVLCIWLAGTPGIVLGLFFG